MKSRIRPMLAASREPTLAGFQFPATIESIIAEKEGDE